MPIEFKDKTGDLVSLENIREAQQVVSRAMIRDILNMPNELAVQLGNISRCLKELEAIRRVLK